MLFKPELIEKIVTGGKTQTRRPVKNGEVLRQIENPHGGYKPVGVYQNNRAKMLIGRDYAVQPGRGKAGALFIPNTGALCFPGDAGYAEMYEARHHVTLETVFAPPGEGYEFLRIQVLNIRCEDVRKISHADALAEGFKGRIEFWRVWCEFYDPAIAVICAKGAYDSYVRGDLNKRPDELYQAWAYTFEVLR